MDIDEVKKNNEEEGLSIYDHREYNIKDNLNDYILKIEAFEKNIDITISINDNIECNYKAQKSSLDIINILELDSVKYSTSFLILKKFDDIYKNKKFLINVNNNDDFCVLLIEEKYELKLCKNNFKDDEKFNLLYNKIKNIRINNTNNAGINEINNKIIELNTKLQQKDKEIQEIKDIINIKENVINEMNKKIKGHENRIKDLEMRSKNIFDENQKLNELNNKIAIFEKNFIAINKNFIKINGITTDVNNLKQNLNILNNTIKENENMIKQKRENDEKIINKVNNEIIRIQNYIKMKFDEQTNINDKINNIILFDNK
jgi:hypothetical protein